MNLGTQVGSALSHPEDSFQSPSRSTGDESVLCLRIDQTKSMVEAYNQIRAELQLARDHISCGEELAPLSDEDMSAFEQIVLKVGLENVPRLQLKQLANAGVQGVIRTLRGVKIQLVMPEDNDSDTSKMDTSHASLPLEGSEADPLALNYGGPEQEEGELSQQSFSPEQSNPSPQRSGKPSGIWLLTINFMPFSLLWAASLEVGVTLAERK